MNDRFLFRGKRLDNGKWYQGSYLYLKDAPNYDWTGTAHKSKGDVHFIIDERDINYAVNPETIGQCTGLKDTNGILIFEGDILHLDSNAKFNDGKVVWDNDLLSYTILFSNGAYRELGLMHGRVDIHIIGNIYDNPDFTS